MKYIYIWKSLFDKQKFFFFSAPISEIKEIRKGVQTDVFCEVFKGQKRQMMVDKTFLLCEI